MVDAINVEERRWGSLVVSCQDCCRLLLAARWCQCLSHRAAAAVSGDDARTLRDLWRWPSVARVVRRRDRAVYQSEYWKNEIAPRVPTMIDREQAKVTRLVATPHSVIQ